MHFLSHKIPDTLIDYYLRPQNQAGTTLSRPKRSREDQRFDVKLKSMNKTLFLILATFFLAQIAFAENYICWNEVTVDNIAKCPSPQTRASDLVCSFSQTLLPKALSDEMFGSSSYQSFACTDVNTGTDSTGINLLSEKSQFKIKVHVSYTTSGNKQVRDSVKTLIAKDLTDGFDKTDFYKSLAEAGNTNIKLEFFEVNETQELDRYIKNEIALKAPAAANGQDNTRKKKSSPEKRSRTAK